MRLQVILPTQVLIDTEVTKVIAEAENGAFCLLPRHIDFVATLVPSLFSFVPQGGQETFLAVDDGVLVKCGPDVRVSTRHAVQGSELGQLQQTIEAQFRTLDEREALARAILAKLEADTVRRFVKLGERVA
jgi:F-type H+-transporting ATPase subunit epsilon